VRWDVASGLTRSDTTAFANGSIVLAGDADNDGSFDTITVRPTFADAINGASDGYTILVATGTYTEAITLTKALTIRPLPGADVVLSPASDARAVSIQAAAGDTDGLGGRNVTLANLRIQGGKSAVYVTKNAGAGVLTLDRVNIVRNRQYGLFLEGDGTGPAGANGAAALIVRDSTFTGNGFQGSQTSNAKLYGFTGDATFENVVVTGEHVHTVTGEPVAIRNDQTDFGQYAIDLVGVPNLTLASVIPTTRLGNVRFTNVTVTGPFKKTAVALYNYGDLGRLTIDSLDLSGAVAEWRYVFNLDGITASYDASVYGLVLPVGTRVHTSLQGDKSGQTPTSQQIVGTASNDFIQGKDANDVLEGGVGNDALNGGAGSDTLRGGVGDDSLHGGADDDVDLLFGGDGNNDVVVTGNVADYRVEYVLAAASSGQPCSNGTSTAAKVIRLSNGSFDCAWDIERVVFVSDLDNYVRYGTGVNGTVAAGGIVIGAQNQSFSTLQAAVTAANAGAVITLNAPMDLSSEGLVSITQDNLTVQGPAGTVVAGFVLASGVTTFRLSGDFDARVTGNDAANRIYGNSGANVIDGRGGNDVIVGGGGTDRLSGGNGSDLIVATGNGPTLGGAGDDRIVLAGGSGSVLGGSGNDTFIVGAMDQNANLHVQSVIADFVRGADKVNLGDLQKNSAALTLQDVLTGAVSTETSLNLNGLAIDGGTGTVSGSLTLYLLDDTSLSNDDFTFVDAQETWRADAGVTP
jgi:Ca2+-binding RTX toxin-like protein